MEGPVYITREIAEFKVEKFQMGCCASDMSAGVSSADHTSGQNGTAKHVLNGVAKSERNGTAKHESNGSVQPSDRDVALFKQLLMERLMTIANEPPLAPLFPIEGDSRSFLVPSLFQCAETLAELRVTPIPPETSVVITYLKSGTHWVWEIMKMLKKGEAIADQKPKEMSHLEFFPPSILMKMNGQKVPVCATHFPFWTLPKSCYENTKLVYVYRNPKDVCVSLFHHFQGMSAANPKDFPPLGFDQFFEMFMAPSEAGMMGSWFDNVADYWDNHRDDKNILCVMFENIKKDPIGEVERIDEHLGTKASDDLIKQIVNVTSFKQMKEDKKSSEQHLDIVFKGTMYRKGEVGDWRNHFNADQSRRVDERLEQWQSERSEPVPLVFEL